MVCVIRHEIGKVFRERVGHAVERQIDVSYVFREPQNLPDGFSAPPGRKKPWGTGHAVLCCQDVVPGNFAVINADDFYGATSYRTLAGFLTAAHDIAEGYHYAMMGYVLRNTLSEHGAVAWGVCQVGPTGYLESVQSAGILYRHPTAPSSRMKRASCTLSPRSSLSP